MTTPTKCDMCGSSIVNNKCSCGTWCESEEASEGQKAFEAALKYFHKMENFTFSADAPQLGAAVVFFRGDYNDCKKIKKFIYFMKGRPHYEE
jgi:hypothetical protein